MKLPLFKLEDYYSEREFKAKYMISGSDLESLPMPQLIEMADQECLSLWKNLPLHYTDTQGNALLRTEIAKLYGTHIQEKNIFCFAGAEEGIFCMAHTLLCKSDHAIVITPCYQSLEAIPASICETTKIPLHYENHWQLNIENIENAIRSNTKLIIINFPHNPTGTTIDCTIQNELIILARKHNIWIFSDEVYRLLELDEQNRLPPIADIYEKGISLNVLSKAYGLAGLRIGWISSQDKSVLQSIAKIKYYLSICNSAPSEILALIALRTADSILARNMKIVLDNIKLLDKFFEQYSQFFEWIRPKGGCIGFPLFKGLLSADMLAEQLLEKESILILPGSVYDMKDQHFRISFGRLAMPEALQRLEYFIKDCLVE